MKTEKEKMRSGELYCFAAPELQESFERAAQFKQKQRKVKMREMNCKWLRMSNIS